MYLTITQLNEQFQDVARRLTDSVHTLDKQVTEINVSPRCIKWIGVFVATCGVGILGISYIVVQKATRIEDAVITLQKETADLKRDSKERDTQFLTALDSLARIEKSLAAGRPANEQPR
jgi:hypothetical protein